MKKKYLQRMGMVIFLLACSCLFTYFTGCWGTEGGQTWQQDSEDLVWGRILQMQQGDENPGGFLGYYAPQKESGYLEQAFLNGEVEGDYEEYTHQTGLQGTAFGIINRLLQPLSPQSRMNILKFGNSVLLVFGMLLVCIWLGKRMGITAGVLAFSSVLLCRYSTMAMPNLYWVIWTILLPMLAAIAVCEMTKSRERLSAVGIILVGIAAFIRFLCGFEYTSTVMVAAEIPVLLEWTFAEKKNRGLWVRLGLWLAVSQLSAFMAAMVIWILQDFWLLKDWNLVIQDILSTIAKRTGAFSQWMPEEDVFEQSLQVGKIQVVGRYLTEAVYMGKVSITGLVVCAAVSLLPVVIWEKMRKNSYVLTVRQLKYFALAAVSCLAPVSWYVLASGHSWIHIYVNMLLWLFPALPMLLGVIGNNIAVLERIERGDGCADLG